MRTRVKFCGLVRPGDVDAAVALGVDAIGLVFYPRSPRLLDEASAAALRRRLPSWVGAVGLFVNAPAAQIGAVHARVGFDVIQFHGDETPAEAAAVVAGLSGGQRAGAPLVWWKALRIGAAMPAADPSAVDAPVDPAAADPAAADPSAAGMDPRAAVHTGRVAGDPAALLAALDAFGEAEHCLLDSASAGFGGSGHRFDWSVVPPARSRRLILSGGLDAASVGEAIRGIGPFAVDTSSGIQGVTAREKDVGRMERFMAAVRQADSHCADDGKPVPTR